MCTCVCVIDLLSGEAGSGWVLDQPADSEVNDLTSLLSDREDFLSAGCLPGASKACVYGCVCMLEADVYDGSSLQLLTPCLPHRAPGPQYCFCSR